jgi:hypothetical protein
VCNSKWVETKNEKEITMNLYSRGTKSQPLDINNYQSIVDADGYSLVKKSEIDGRSVVCYSILDHKNRSVISSLSNKSEAKKIFKVLSGEQVTHAIQREGTWGEIETVCRYTSKVGQLEWDNGVKIGSLSEFKDLVNDKELWATPYEVFFNIDRSQR